jgi:acetyl-CoA carboxylase carboxyltransferase component
VFNTLLARLITFPSESYVTTGFGIADDSALVPTIAAVNGHCFAGGYILAMACDYRVMTDGSKRNAWICMNEVSSYHC